jgi:hypothetical protein
MKGHIWVGVASIALVVAGCAPYTYNSGTTRSSRYSDATDFNGDWQLVTGGSDYGRSWIDARNNYRNDDEWGTFRGTDDTRMVRTRYAAWFLPDEFRIEGSGDVLRIEDLDGNLLSEIDLNSSDYRYGSYENGRELHARWVSDRRFQVDRATRSGRRLTQTFSIGNRGRRLMVVTELEREGSTRSFTRIYRRA